MVEIGIGSRVRTSPYYASTLKAGVSSFTTYNHMYMPIGFGDPVGEYERLTTSVSLWDVAAERQVEIYGPDATAMANYLSARDLTGMKVGRARYAPLCDFGGRMINDPVALRVDDDRYWFSLADSDILLWAKAIAAERGYDVAVSEPDVSPLAIQGPKAMSVARDLFGAELIDSLGFFHHRPAKLDDIPVVVCRSGWSKQGGVELFLTDGTKGDKLWDLVMEAGAGYGIGPGSPNQQERIETGLLSFGSDHIADTDPIEAGLGAFTDVDSDRDFIGRDALRERRQRPVRNNIVNIRLHGDPSACESPWSAEVDGTPIGQVRNTVWSTALNEWIGLAQLATPFDAAGTTFNTTDPTGRVVPCVVHHLPFGENQIS